MYGGKRREERKGRIGRDRYDCVKCTYVSARSKFTRRKEGEVELADAVMLCVWGGGS